MKKTISSLISIFIIITISAQSFKEKVYAVEFDGNKTFPPSLYMNFNYPSNTLTVIGSESSNVFNLTYVASNTYSNRTEYIYDAKDPEGFKCAIGIYVYSDKTIVIVRYPKMDITYYIFK
jgi:hypothetical protein